jgi:DNA-binding IclR family transcriptional regulator
MSNRLIFRASYGEYGGDVPGSVQVLERAAAILRLLGRSRRPLGVVQIAHSLDLAKGTIHGILRTLQDVGFIEQDPHTGKYGLVAALAEFGSGQPDPNELRSRSINWSDSLAARSGEAAYVGILLGGEVHVVHHVFRPDTSTQTVKIGVRLPAHASALGKVLLAYDAGAEVDDTRAQLGRFTQHTLCTPAELTRELTMVRQVGWAGEVEELVVGEAGIAAPIRDRGRLVVGAVGISGAVDHICDGRFRPQPDLIMEVVNAGRVISRELGSDHAWATSTLRRSDG